MERINNKKQLEVSLPIAFENLMGVLMTLIDTVVISTIGVIELGAIGAMSVILSIMEMGIHAIHVSNNTLVAREIGKDDKSQIKLFAGNAILMTVLLSIITIIIIYFLSPVFPSLFNVDKICITYLIIRLFGFIQGSLSHVIAGYQRTIGHHTNILTVRFIAVISNLFFDYIVVKLGYGIVGVAWVTVLIDTIQLIYLSFKARKNVNLKYNKDIFKEILSLVKWNYFERIVSKIDQFVFNIVVSRMGPLEYAVHVILIQIVNVYESFVSGFGEGISINVGIASGDGKERNIHHVENVAKKIINKCSVIFPVIIFFISIIVMKISMKEMELQIIFYEVLPVILLGCYITTSATYYLAVIRGFRDFKFLAVRNTISSSLKIVLSIILAYTPLGILGVWISHLLYSVSQRILSKQRYISIYRNEEKI